MRPLREAKGRPTIARHCVRFDTSMGAGDLADVIVEAVDIGDVRIVDRKTEIILNSAGKNMSPLCRLGDSSSC